jgi:hypothetical protein
MFKHHHDRPPDALAHGRAKASDIERVRRDMARAERHMADHRPAAPAPDGRRTGVSAEPRHGRAVAGMPR